MTDINIQFCQMMLKNVIADVKGYDPSIKAKDADTYIESYNGDGKHRWFTFKYKDFYWENYVDNAYDGRTKAWLAFLESKGYKGVSEIEE